MKPGLEKKVIRHGEDLIKAFGLPIDTDPLKLCRRLRALENEAAVLTTKACNGDIDGSDDAYDNALDKILEKANVCLDNTGIPVFINRDPRGYALKIRDRWMHANPEIRLHRDWGGYGILAPDLRES